MTDFTMFTHNRATKVHLIIDEIQKINPGFTFGNNYFMARSITDILDLTMFTVIEADTYYTVTIGEKPFGFKLSFKLPFSKRVIATIDLNYDSLMDEKPDKATITAWGEDQEENAKIIAQKVGVHVPIVKINIMGRHELAR